MISIDLKPKDNILNQFRWISLMGFFLLSFPLMKVLNLFGLVLSKHQEYKIAGFCILLGIIVFLIGTINVRWLKPIYIGLILVFYPLGFVVGNALLFLIYIGIFIPIGMVFKIMGRDELNIKRCIKSKNPDSYWKKYHPKREAKSYYRQF